jgi:hypothetical protein
MKHKINKRKIFQVLIRYNFIFFPFLWITTLFLGLIEVWTYAGFFSKHIFLGLEWFLPVTILSGMIARIFYLDEQTFERGKDYYRVLSILNKFIFFPFLLGAVTLVILESKNYPNYVFSKFHLHPRNTFWVIFLSFYLVLINIESLGKKWFMEELFLDTIKVKKKRELLTLRGLVNVSVLGVIIWFLSINLHAIIPSVIKNSHVIIKYPLASYEEKMRLKWDDFYNYMNFIKENTPEDAVIMFPPKIRPWLSAGNEQLVRYFLYPRRILQDYENPNAQINKMATYAMITWGGWTCEGENCHGWPKVEISAEWIIYKEKDSTGIENKLENTVYNPEDDINKSAWGLIKLKTKEE